jgi:hypothetical protein
MVLGGGSAAITGAVISCTVTVCKAVDEFPQTSVAVHVLVTVYSAGQSPGTIISVDPSVNGNPHPSDAATEKEGNAGQLIVAEGGMGMITGGMVSTT